MTCPCITVYEDNDQFSFQKCQINYLTSEARFSGTTKNVTGTLFTKPDNELERYDKISNWAIDIIKDCDKILIEDYSMGSKGRVFHIAENTAFLKYKLFTLNKNFAAYPPTSLKKYASGKGNSDKTAMFTAFFKETNINLPRWFSYKGKKIVSPISDIVDSFYLCKCVALTKILE